MIVLPIYFIIGLIWTYYIDRYSYERLGVPSMKFGEVLIQVILWPVSIMIFSYTFFKETFRKKN